VVYGATDTPQAILDRATLSSTIQISEAYCIGDVDVDIDITHTYIGDLIVDLQSPGGTTVRLHNHTGGSGQSIVQRYDDEAIPRMVRECLGTSIWSRPPAPGRSL